MKLDVLTIPANGLDLRLEEEGSALQAIAGKVDYSILSPVTANLTVLQAGGEVFIRGGMTSRVKVQCARCLKEFEYALNSTIEVVYRIARENEVEEKELSKEEMDINYIEGNEIDTNEILFEQLSLDLPLQRLCSTDCKGLCPNCGADLNKGRCGCSLEGNIDPRLAKLKELKLK